MVGPFDGTGWPLWTALGAAALCALAEWLHLRRVRRLAGLAFGPARRPALWARAAGGLRTVSCGAVTWGLMTLLFLPPKSFGADADVALPAEADQHILLLLDVSPSMRLVDSGPNKEQSRMQRTRDLVESFFRRVPLETFRVSVVAFYTEAKPVVIDTHDIEVVRNILGDLPMHFAFESGETRILDGLEEAARIARPWNPKSTTLVVLTDGDTVPAQGMPRMPDSIRSVLVVGVGDPHVGSFIDGRQSRQDIPALRQVAARLRGTFHNGTEKHLSTDLVFQATGRDAEDVFEKLTVREYALLATILGAAALALLPLLLHFFGTNWRPGTSAARVAASHSGFRVGSLRREVPAHPRG